MTENTKTSQIAYAAYKGYWQTVNGGYFGENPPEWDSLPETVQTRWMQVALATFAVVPQEDANEQRLPFTNYDSNDTYREMLHFPDLGNVTITFERSRSGEVRPVLSFDFNPTKVRILDQNGNDRSVSTMSEFPSTEQH